MNTARLRFFSDSYILGQVGRPLLARFFDALAHLMPSKYFLPNPRPDNDHYFDSLADILERTSELPAGLAQALNEVEALAADKGRDNDSQNTDATILSQAIRSWLNSRRPGALVGEAPASEAPPTAPPSPAPDAQTPFLAPEPQPWPRAVDAKSLLAALVQVLKRLVVLPKSAAETLALWILHTYAFHLRDVTTYIGIESPEMRCGKTTLLTLLAELANRALASSNISPPAFFRVIEDLSPTLLIDEMDTFLTGNDQLRGILNAGYHRKTAFVLRAAPSIAASGDADAETSAPPAAVKRYSCWCPKVLAKIGRLPDTLADRCIIIRMQRKTEKEQCERSRDLDPAPLKQQCLRFVADHASEIASAKPRIPRELNDRAADIWEPLLVLADLAGDEWPALARQAAISLSAGAQESAPIAALLLDILILFTEANADRMFTNSLLEGLNRFGSRPWNEARKGKETTDLWLAQQLRPYGVKSRTIRLGDKTLKGYVYSDLLDVFQRYVPKSTLQAFLDENTAEPPKDPGEC